MAGWEDLAQLLPDVYRDTAKPSAQKVGQALSSIVGLIVVPVGKAAEIGQNNLLRLVERLDKIPEASVTPVPPELGIPIYEKLRYTRGEELADLYIELFAKGATKEDQDKAHPSYFEIITNLSVDEAKILDYLNHSATSVNFPYIEVRSSEGDGSGKYIVASKYFTLLPDEIEFYNPNNVQMYLENLVRLGILDDEQGIFLADDNEYKPLIEHLKVLEMKRLIEESKRLFSTSKSCFSQSSFGETFLKACMPDVEIDVTG